MPKASYLQFMAQFGDVHPGMKVAHQWLNRLMVIDVFRTMLLDSWFRPVACSERAASKLDWTARY